MMLETDTDFDFFDIISVFHYFSVQKTQGTVGTYHFLYNDISIFYVFHILNLITQFYIKNIVFLYATMLWIRF